MSSEFYGRKSLGEVVILSCSASTFPLLVCAPRVVVAHVAARTSSLCTSTRRLTTRWAFTTPAWRSWKPLHRFVIGSEWTDFYSCCLILGHRGENESILASGQSCHSPNAAFCVFNAKCHLEALRNVTFCSRKNDVRRLNNWVTPYSQLILN